MTFSTLSPTGLALLLEGIDELDVGISVFDRDLTLIAANRHFCRMLGFPPALGQPGARLEDCFRLNAQRGEYGPGAVADLVRQRLDLARQFLPHCFERTRPDGTVIEVRGHPLADGGMATIYTDITVQRQRERALKELSEELERRVDERTAELRHREEELARKTALLEQVMSHVHHGVTLFDRDLNLGLCNPQFLEIMRVPAEHGAPGTPFEALIRANAERGEYGAGDIETQVRARVERAKQRLAHRFERTRPDGTAIEVIGSPTADGGFVTTYLDITDRKRSEAALRDSEARFRDFASASSDWFFETDADLRFSYVSNRFLEVTGLPPEAILGKTRSELAGRKVRAEAPVKWHDHLADLNAHRPFRDFDYPLRGADGAWRHIRISGVPRFDVDGTFLGYRGTGTDITQIKAVEQALRESEAQLRAILEASPVGVALISSADRTIRFCNQRLAQLLGETTEQLIGHSPCQSCENVLSAWGPDQSGLDTEAALKRADGSEWWGLISVRPIPYQGKDAMLVWAYDVTELHLAREQMERMAHHDALTGLPNRRHFERAAGQALLRAKRLGNHGSLLFFDLDGFKSVNDRYGHAVGDALLRTIGEGLTRRLRSSDFIARLGGDEFAVITEDRSRGDDLEAVAQNIIATIVDAAHDAAPGCQVSASIGIAYFDASGPDLTTLMRRADDAMYRAKADGKATVRHENGSE